jgi:hypothetical protein
MALTTVTIEVAKSNLWTHPETLTRWQIITGWEKYENQFSEMKTRKWSLWSNAAILEVGEGDFMTVTGDLATKLDKWTKDGEDKTVVGHSLYEFTVGSHDTSKRRGGDLLGVDQDDVRKYGHPTYGTPDGTLSAGEAPF